MTFEKWLAGIIKERSINLSEMARKTEIPYQSLNDSFFSKGRNRELRSSELLSICVYLGVNPMDFVETGGGIGEKKIRKRNPLPTVGVIGRGI